MQSIQTKVDNNYTVIQDGVDSLMERLHEITAEVCGRLFPNNDKLTSEEYAFIEKCLLEKCTNLRKEEVL